MLPTALYAVGFPADFATSLYVKTFPFGIFFTTEYTFSLKVNIEMSEIFRYSVTVRPYRLSARTHPSQGWKRSSTLRRVMAYFLLIYQGILYIKVWKINNCRVVAPKGEYAMIF